MPTLRILYASTSGHTEYVVSVLSEALSGLIKNLTINTTRAELVKPENLLEGDVLLLASGTWNTGSVEGQFNPHMHALLVDRAAAVDLKGKKVLAVGLGDERYRYTCRAADLLEKFVNDHHGTLLAPALRIVNEPYGQEEKVRSWAKEISSLIQ